MGVHGLTTYVDGNKNFLQDVKFRNSRLIIDGCSLYFRLYFSHCLDQQYGGDYYDFYVLLSQFLSALEACNIQPYVVLDGGIDPSDKKFSTIRQRLQSKIKEADNLSHGRRGSVLPILTRDLFIQVLGQRGIPLFQCPFEADKEIACLAHQWNCPVLSNDSDFYIFDLPGGYMPLHFFQWTNLNGKASHRYISARCYTTAGLCRWFGGMNKMLLPLCAVLSGNDYGAPKGVENFLQLLDENARKDRGKGIPRIESVLVWLSSFPNPKEALEEVSRLMKNEVNSQYLKSELWAAMQEYCIPPHSPLALWFSESRVVPSDWIHNLPACFSQEGPQGLLSPMVVDAVVMNRVILIPQVENSKLASSHNCARVLRQAVYGILLLRRHETQGISQGTRGSTGRGGRGSSRGRGGRGQGTSVSTQPGVNAGASAAPMQVAQGASVPVCVEEYDRMDLNLKKNQVEAQVPKSPVHLDTLNQASVAVRLCVLLEVLGIKESDLAPVPVHLRLAVAVTGFWLREARPTPSQVHLQALVLGLVYGELSWTTQTGAAPRQHTTPPMNLPAERNVLIGLNRLRLRQWDRQGLDVGVAHSLSQWQACLWSALCLNQVLLLPTLEPRLPWLFSGTLVHGLVRYLKAGQVAESLLPGGTLSAQLYSSLLAAVKKCSSKIPQHSSAGQRGKRGRQRGSRGRGRGGRGRGARGTRGACRGRGAIRELDNMFAALMSDDEFDDGW
ncbi:protein asteroid homolog 1 [Takifugu rubripes]|uniref:Asteroid domain-containing protein n=1 Tax=Takifugu rubripes TaxID=31033 RepID=H2TFT9_TAKRU|nr:protein asteroid homolog 1 [Takifugu rubripes]XP_011607171.2 protein asteroid homolog 1 [Takifugu rubripes]